MNRAGGFGEFLVDYSVGKIDEVAGFCFLFWLSAKGQRNVGARDEGYQDRGGEIEGAVSLWLTRARFGRRS